MMSRFRDRPAWAALLAGATLLAGALPAVAQDAERPEIVWLEQGAGNPYWDAQHAAAAAAGEDLGFDFRAVSGNSDPASQAATLTQLVDQGVDAIMLNAIDPTATAPGVAYAAENGVPVVSLYAIDPNAAASVTFDEIKVGETAAKHALMLLEAKNGTPTGQIAILHGIQGQPASDQRSQGFEDYMATQDGVEIVAVQPTGWSADEASATMQDWLVTYPELDMVYALSDTLAVPAMNVAERENKVCTAEADWTANPECIVFVAVDGIFVDEVVGGRLWGTQLYSPQWSGFAFAEVANAVATGGEAEPETYLDALLVTSENAECVAAMQAEMAADPASFPFEGSLADIAAARGCPEVSVG
jgi:ABC-type sugar transport system substrate-binding protein